MTRPLGACSTGHLMIIEPATVADHDAICAVLAEGDAHHREHLPDVFQPTQGPVRPRDFLARRIEGPDSAILVARDGGAIVGVVELVLKPPIEREGLVPRRLALLDNVVVRATDRGRGIGTQLVTHAEAWARERGAEAMELHVWSFNEPARRLYERLGYAARTVRMERPLTAWPGDGMARRPTPPPRARCPAHATTASSSRDGR